MNLFFKTKPAFCHWWVSTIVGIFCCPLCVFSFPSGDGWTPLFNGKTLDGWEVCNGFGQFIVEDGCIVGRTADASPNTFLKTRKHYEDFELVFEVKLDEGLNSGIQIHSRLRDWGSHHFFGPQVEIESSPGQTGFVWGEGMPGGWIFAPTDAENADEIRAHSVFKNGEWNQFRIHVSGDRIRVSINGEIVSDFESEKLKRFFPVGAIGLQVHQVPVGTHLEVRWRNLSVREI